MFNHCERVNGFKGRSYSGVLLALGVVLALGQMGQNAWGAGRAPDYPINIPNVTPGVQYKAWYSGSTSGQMAGLPNPPLGTPDAQGTVTMAPFIFIPTSGTASNPTSLMSPTTTNFEDQWDALFKVPADATYTLGSASDDGSAIYIGVGTATETLVDNNNFSQGVTQRQGTIALAAGYHKITIFFAQGGGGYGMTAAYQNSDTGTAYPPTNIDNNLFLLPPAKTPVITAAVSSAPQYKVTITTPTPPTANVFYTTDGSTPGGTGTTPSGTSALYSGPFFLTPGPGAGTTIKAGNIITGFSSSYAAPVTLTLPTTATPAFTSAQTAPNFSGSEVITMTSATPSAFIYYTNDGSTPTLSNFTGVLPSPAQVTINANTTFTCFASGNGFNASGTASMSYTRTDVAPAIFSALASGVNTQVNVVFSKKVDATAAANPNSGNNPANYTITDTAVPPNVIPVTAAVVESGTITLPDTTSALGDGVTVRLTTGVALTPGTAYILTVANVKDTSTPANIIPLAGISYPFQYFFGGGLLYERWDNIAGVPVASLTSSPLFPDFPTSTDVANNITPASGSILPTFEELPQPTNITSYGSRLKGYFIAPATASIYNFYLTADDNATLSISSDDNPNRKSAHTAQDTTAVASRQWSAGATISNVSLVAGQRYYIETLHKQDTSVDNLAVTYQFGAQAPVDFATGPIDNSMGVQLTPIVEGLRAVTQPFSRILTLNQAITLTFDVAGSAPRAVQWYFTPAGSAGPAAPIAGATTEKYVLSNTAPAVGFQTTDAGTYYCTISNTITTTPIQSQNAVLKVLDTFPPSFTSITPNFGLVNTATNIQVSGTHFVDGMQVYIGGIACTNIVTVNPTTITCTSPLLARNTYNVTVVKPGNSTLPIAPATIKYFSDDRPVAVAPAANFSLAEDPAAPFPFTIKATSMSNLPQGLAFQSATAQTLTAGSTTINNSLVTVASTAGVQVGAAISGTNIPAKASVLTINSATTLTISINGSTSANATATGANLTFTVQNPNPALTLVGGTTTNASTNITVNSTVGALVGSVLTGPGIPAGATIATIAPPTKITLSAAATATGSNVSFVVYNPFLTLKGGTVQFGSVAVTGTGPYTSTCSATYQPALNANDLTLPLGADAFFFSASDGLLSAVPVTANFNVSPVNDPPAIVKPADVTTAKNLPTTVTVTGIGPGGGTDEATQTLTLSISSDNPTLFQDATFTNTLFINGGVNNVAIPANYPATASVTFTPHYSGSANVTITVTETNTASLMPPSLQSTITFKVTATYVNDAPVIDQLPDQAGIGDQPGSFLLTGIAPAPPNTPDENSQIVVLSVASSDVNYFTSLTVSAVSGGTATLNYTPTIAKHGPVTITVTASDGQASNSLTNMKFVLTLSAVNHPPTAKNDTYAAVVGRTLNVPAPGVLGNDIDIDGNAIFAVIAAQPTNGTVVLNADGSFSYSPNPGFAGSDSFSYQADDRQPLNNISNAANVTISVGPDAAPVATNLALSTPEDKAVSSVLPATDANFDVLTYSIVTPPVNGSVAITNATTGAFTYAPKLFYRGSDSFTFKANDGTFDSNTATVAITMTPVNHAPVAVDKVVRVGVNTTTLKTALSITLDANDPDSDPLAFTIVTQPANGTLGTLSGNAVTYTPNVGFTGNDAFKFSANDGSLTSNKATISIVVTPAPLFDSMPSITPNPAFVGQNVNGFASAGTAVITWDFGDASPVVVGSAVTHTYAVAGVYLVTITATSAEGLVTTSVQSVAISLAPGGTVPPGTFQPGVYGFLVGGKGLIKGSKASLKVNYVARDKTSLTVLVSGISFPSSLNLGSLVGQPGILTIGTGPLAEQFVFTLDNKGKGKATGLPAISFNFSKGQFAFKTSQRRTLTDLIIAIGAANSVPGTNAGTQIIDIPVTVQIGGQLYLALTVEVTYKQGTTTGSGSLNVGKRTK